MRDHWTDAVLAAARTGNPLTYGASRLHSAHHHLTARVSVLESQTETHDPRLCQAQADLETVRLASHARDVDIARARALATHIALNSTAQPPSVQRYIGPEL
jgi:hypothetical protein